MDHRFVVPKSMSMHCHAYQKYTAGVQNPDASTFQRCSSNLYGIHIRRATLYISMVSSGLTTVKMELQGVISRDQLSRNQLSRDQLS